MVVQVQHLTSSGYIDERGVPEDVIQSSFVVAEVNPNQKSRRQLACAVIFLRYFISWYLLNVLDNHFLADSTLSFSQPAVDSFD